MIRIAIIVCNSLLLVALAEGVARIAEWLRPPASELTFDYAPYRMLRMVKAPWPLNREGFRARELDAYRNKFLVEFLGASVCVGVGTDVGRILPERLEEALHRAGMREAAVLNLCQGGAPSAQELAIFLEYGLPLAPQVVLSFNGANDLMHPLPVGDDEAPNLPFRDREIRAQFNHGFMPHLALARVAARIAQHGADPPARPDRGVPPQAILSSYLYAIEVVRTLTTARHGLYAVLLQPTLHYEKPWSGPEAEMWSGWHPADGAVASRHIHGLYAAAGPALAEWSAATGAPVFDLTHVFSQTKETVYSDSVHFSGPRGYEMLEQELVRLGLLEKIAGRYRTWEQRQRANSESSALWPH